MENEFVKLTKEMLNINENDNRIARNGFNVIGNNKTKYVLFLGINPAGDENDSKNEQDDDFLYLHYIPKLEEKINVNKTYSGAIYKLMTNICGEENIKWDWCNLSEEELNRKINKNSKLKRNSDIIMEFYNKHKDSEYTILEGDLFYYHMTSSNKLEFNKENISIENINKILELHIEKIKNNNLLKFIYINNAKASRIIAKNIKGKEDFGDSKFEFDYKKNKYDVFLGGMLSGKHPMDIYSRQRLEKELKECLENK